MNVFDWVEAELRTVDVVALLDVADERELQDLKWGNQDHPDGTGLGQSIALRESARDACDIAALHGFLTWRHILAEEFYEACAETDTKKLREELIQVAASAVAWVGAIDRREGRA